MKTFKIMDPEMIMTIVISLIILAIGTFAFYITLQNIPNTGADFNSQMSLQINNTSDTGGQVFNVIGIVLIIGAIMTIVGLVYSYVRPGGY